MNKIAMLLGILVMAGCQSGPPPLIPGQLFPDGFLNVRAPNSEGWVLIDASRQGKAFTRRGISSSDSYIAKVFGLSLPEFKDRNEFVAFIKQRFESNTSPERFKSIENNYEYTEKRGYPCVRVNGGAEDTKARTPSGQEILKYQFYSLACQHPKHKGGGFVIDYSHRDPSLDTTLDTQAEAFIEGVQVPEK